MAVKLALFTNMTPSFIQPFKIQGLPFRASCLSDWQVPYSRQELSNQGGTIPCSNHQREIPAASQCYHDLWRMLLERRRNLVTSRSVSSWSTLLQCVRNVYPDTTWVLGVRSHPRAQLKSVYRPFQSDRPIGTRSVTKQRDLFFPPSVSSFHLLCFV